MKRHLLLAATALLAVGGAHAQQPFVGQIMWVPYNFAPLGWANCDGQLLPISENEVLFTLIGTTYGGDGKTTFALPNVQSQTIVHRGQGIGLTNRELGEPGGAEVVNLTVQQLPLHTHALQATKFNGDTSLPDNALLASAAPPPGDTTDLRMYRQNTAADEPMHAEAISAAGSGLAADNVPPVLTLRCVIALEGIFPPPQ